MNNSKDYYDRRFEAWYVRYRKPLLVFTKKMVNSIDIAEELTNEIFVKLYEKKIEIDQKSRSAASYLFSMARNGAIDYLSRSAREQKKYHGPILDEIVLNHEFMTSLEDAYIEEEFISEIGTVLSCFNELERRVFLRRYIMHESTHMVMVREGISRYKVKSIEGRIIDSMRKRLSPYLPVACTQEEIVAGEGKNK